MRQYFVYILASGKNSTLYVGVTGNLERRMYEHASGLTDGFTQKYNVKMLVYYEDTDPVEVALAREKQLKKWNRAWKLELIERTNPNWYDLARSAVISFVFWIPRQAEDDNGGNLGSVFKQCRVRSLSSTTVLACNLFSRECRV